MNVVKFFETLAKIVAEKENVHVNVVTKRKECEKNGIDETPKRCVNSN